MTKRAGAMIVLTTMKKLRSAIKQQDLTIKTMQKILSKLNLIMSECPAMPKDKKNEMQGYKYLMETTVKLNLRDLFAKHKVVPVFSAEQKEFVQIGMTKSGTPNWLTRVTVVYRFYDSESGEFIDGFYDGTGTDTQDKGIYKAVTGAVKNILMQNFLIPTGDDPEKDGEKASKKLAQSPLPIKRITDYEFDTILQNGAFNLDSGVSNKTGKPWFTVEYQDQKHWITEEQHRLLSK
jgi:hypothetical protein